MEAVAQALDMVARVYHANTADELRRVLPGIDARTDVLVAAPDHGYLLHRVTIVSAARAAKIPVVCQQPEYVLEGALLSFDPQPRRALSAARLLCRRGAQGGAAVRLADRRTGKELADDQFAHYQVAWHRDPRPDPDARRSGNRVAESPRTPPAAA